MRDSMHHPRVAAASRQILQLGIAALLSIAAFGVIDAGTAVLPSNLDPSFRWPAAWAQVIGATAAILVLRNQAREKM